MHLPDPSPFAPLPGTTPRPQALFLDRWGTLFEPPPRGFARKPEEVVFVDGALDALFRACQAGWQVYLLGNEDAVAEGKLALEAWKALEADFLERLDGAGVTIVRSYACLEHPGGAKGQQMDSVYLLPNTGAFYHASHMDGVNLKRSWVIGDSTLELVAGWRAGCRLAGVRTGEGLADGVFEVDPEYVGANLSEVILNLLDTRTALQP